MDRPFVIIDLAPHLQDFLYHELKQNRRTGELMADGTHEIAGGESFPDNSPCAGMEPCHI